MIAKTIHKKKYCAGDISTIENYEKAIESNEPWQLHHRLEVEELPDGRIVRRSKKQLIACNHYYFRPPCELIFLHYIEHRRLHMMGNKLFEGKKHTEEFKAKISSVHKGRVFSEESRKKMSDAKRGKVVKYSEDGLKRKREAIIKYNKTRVFSEETRRKISESLREGYRNGRIKPWNKE